MPKNIMTKYDSVPKLNLEPKLKHPLTLWNPLDYLRLFYWILFFPQAVRWYVDRFGSGYVDSNDKNASRHDLWSTLHQNEIDSRLLIQGLLIATLIPILVGVLQLFNYTDIYLNFIETNNFDAFFSFFMAIFMGFFTTKKSGVVEGVLVCFTYGISMGIVNSNALNFIDPNIATTVAGGLSFGLLVITTAEKNVVANITGCLMTGTLVGLIFLVVDLIFNRAKQINISISLFNCLAFGLAVQIGALRLDSWLISLPFFRTSNRTWFFSRTTSIPLPFLTTRLKNWLRKDWNAGIDNISKLLKYTLQFIPVVEAVNKVLAEMPSEQIIYRISNLTKVYDGWRLIYFVSASLKRELLLSILPFRKWLGKRLKKQDFLTTTLRTDTSVRATAAGFWYLHEKQPDKAAEAFAKVRSLLYGEEVYTLAETLAVFQSAKELDRIASLDLPAFPQDNFLRPQTWQTLNSLKQVVEEVKTIHHSISHTTKASALNRAIGELTAILDAPEILLEPERELIIEIAQNWKRSLERIARDIGNIRVTKPVANPYIIGDPVQGSLFAGREDIMRQLEELWSGDRLQSVVLFGHRRMGKTSILLNINNYIDTDVKIAYINLLRLGDSSQGVGEVLMQICDGVAEVTGIASPNDDTLLKLPYRTFERYIKQIEQAKNSLIIAIDEFEKIEELIESQRVPTDFLGFLRGIVQMNPRIALIFAGLHTLEEMTADYFQPFFASVIPLHVDFLNAASTRQILANPINVVTAGSSEFMLDYTPQALDLIYYLTAGQPYLVQLIGFQLVRRYNQQMFERGIVRNSLFAIDDVTQIIDREFFQRGRYYFEGVWGQAAQDIEGQQEIIKALAPYPQGLSELNLIVRVQTTIDEATARNAIAILQRHDVILQTDAGWQIIVELFRRWVNESNFLHILLFFFAVPWF